MSSGYFFLSFVLFSKSNIILLLLLCSSIHRYSCPAFYFSSLPPCYHTIVLSAALHNRTQLLQLRMNGAKKKRRRKRFTPASVWNDRLCILYTTPWHVCFTNVFIHYIHEYNNNNYNAIFFLFFVRSLAETSNRWTSTMWITVCKVFKNGNSQRYILYSHWVDENQCEW